MTDLSRSFVSDYSSEQLSVLLIIFVINMKSNFDHMKEVVDKQRTSHDLNTCTFCVRIWK